MMSRLLVLALALAALLPASAQADPVVLDGSPLNVTLDEFGRIQAGFDDSSGNEFFPPSLPQGNAGFHVALYDASGTATGTYGPSGNGSFTPQDTNQDGNPDGPILTPGDPQRLSTTYFVGPNNELQVDQVIDYHSGDDEFTTTHTITNQSGGPLAFSAAEFADLYLGGSDVGTGFLDPGPPRIVGGVNPTVQSNGRQRGGGIVEVSPSWSSFEANSLGTVLDHLRDPAGPAFDQTIVQEQVDNAVGVQWDNFKTTPLAARGKATYSVRWRFTEFDVPPPPPVPKEKVNIEPEGTVKVKFPPNFEPPPSVRARSAQSSGGFVTLTPGHGLQIPVGSIVDVRKGRIAMTAAADTSGGLVNGKFDLGVFKVKQSGSSSKLLTDLSLSGGSFKSCKASKSSATTARSRRIRRLRGSGRGRFRTRGRYGSATVRGTKWTMEDRCDGTLTSVQSGTVTVRDFARHKNVTVRRGHKYLARPKRR